jgi:hypothetical protein
MYWRVWMCVSIVMSLLTACGASKLDTSQAQICQTSVNGVWPLVDGVNGAPGTFDQLPARAQTVLSENARTVPLQLNAPPPPSISCAELGTIAVPVAIARGTLTRPVFRVAADSAARCIPGATLVLIQDGRHLAPVEMPQTFKSRCSPSSHNRAGSRTERTCQVSSNPAWLAKAAASVRFAV